MELWLAEYRNAKGGKATEKGLKLLNEFDVFDYVEAKLREAPEVGKRGRDDDDQPERPQRGADPVSAQD